MKKIIPSVILYLTLTGASSLFSANIEIPVINLQNPSLQQVVDVNISFSSEKSFIGYQFIVQYNHQVLKLLEVVKGSAVGAFTVMTNVSTPSIVRVAGFHPGFSGISGSGVLAILRFQIIQQGFSSLILSSVKLSDANGKSIPCTATSGSIRAGQTEEKQKPPSVPSSETRKVPLESANVPPIEQPIQTQMSEKTGMVTPPTETGLIKPQDIGGKKSVESTQPSNSVTLLVLSEWGNPVPPPGITTFEKGDRVSCRVETEILIDDMEKVGCTGCEGTGSAPNSKSNSVNFIINEDSKIIWKWKKAKVPPDFLIEIQSDAVLEFSKNEITLPLKARFLGGFNKTVFLYTSKSPDFEISSTETCLTSKNNETFFKIKKRNKEVPAGKYSLSITAETEDKIKRMSKTIEIIVPGNALLGEAIIDETSKLITLPLLVYGKLKDISSFEVNLSIPQDIRFVKLDAGSNKTKIFSGFSQKGKNLKISGGIFPSIHLSDAKFLDIIFSFTNKYNPNNIFTLNECFFWNEGGKLIPLTVKKR